MDRLTHSLKRLYSEAIFAHAVDRHCAAEIDFETAGIWYHGTFGLMGHSATVWLAQCSVGLQTGIV